MILRDENQDSLIEFVLRNREPIEQCVREARIDRLSRTGNDKNTGGGKPNHISDPTAAEALKLVEPIQFVHVPYGAYLRGRRDEKFIRLPEKWLKVEKLTREFYTREGQTKHVKGIYKRRYMNGEYGERWEITCNKLNISRTIYYAVVHDIVRFAGLYAAGMGLISPYSRF